MTTEVERLLVRVEVNQRKAEKDMARLQSQIAGGARKVEDSWRRTNSRVSGGLRNTALQLSQVAQQGAVTGNYLSALAVQLPDLAIGFGALGVAGGALLGILAPMALEFLGAADGAEEYRKRVEALAKATANLQSAVDAANASPRDLIRDFGAYADEMQRVLNVQRELARLDALAALADASDTAEDSLRRVKLLVDDVLSGDRPETPRITRKLNEEFGLTVSQAGQLLAALDQIGEADGPEQIAAAIQDVRELLDPTNDKARELSKMFLEAEKAALSFAAVDIAANVGEGADEAERLLEAMNRVAALDFKQSAKQYSGRGSGKYELGLAGEYNAPDTNDIFERFRRSSRRSGGGSRSRFDPLASGERQIGQLQNQIQALGQASGAVATLTAKYQLLEAAKRRGIDLDKVNAETGKTVRQEIEAQAATIGDLTSKYQQASEQSRFFNDMSLQLSDGLVDSIVQAENLAGVMSNLAQQIAKAALQAALFGSGPFSGLFGSTPGVGILSGLAGARAGGGGVKSGLPYLVNENTPNSEVFVPSQNGAILNVAQAQQALRSSAASTPNVSVAPTPVQVVVVDDLNRIGEYMKSPQGRMVFAQLSDEQG